MDERKQLLANDTARRLVAGGVGVLAAGAVVGYLVGTSRSGVSELVGDAYSTEAGITIMAEGAAYEVPLNVTWRDADGRWVSGGRPECLPPSGGLSDIRFAAVPWKTSGIGGNVVVAVFCD